MGSPAPLTTHLLPALLQPQGTGAGVFTPASSPVSLVASFAPLCPLVVPIRFLIPPDGPSIPFLMGPQFGASLGTLLTPLSLTLSPMDSATLDFGSVPSQSILVFAIYSGPASGPWCFPWPNVTLLYPLSQWDSIPPYSPLPVPFLLKHPAHRSTFHVDYHLVPL